MELELIQNKEPGEQASNNVSHCKVSGSGTSSTNAPKEEGSDLNGDGSS